MLIKHLQQFEQDNLKQLDFFSLFLNKRLSILTWPCYSPFSQLIRQSLLTLSERRAGRFLFAMSPENSLSHGTVVAGVARYLQGSSASLSWAPEWADHRSSGQSCSVQVHDSVCKTRFLIFTSLLRWGLSMQQSFQMWSMSPSLSLLGRHSKSLNIRFKAVALGFNTQSLCYQLWRRTQR